jgi:hypothetical protein
MLVQEILIAKRVIRRVWSTVVYPGGKRRAWRAKIKETLGGPAG